MQVVSRTHVGLVRENNEDALLVREPYLFAVADGMGGYAAGEVASRSTIKAFETATYSLRHEQGEQNIFDVLQEAFAKANMHVLKMAASNDKFNGISATAGCIYIAMGICSKLRGIIPMWLICRLREKLRRKKP